MRRIYDLWYSIGNRLEADIGAAFVLKLIEDLNNPVSNPSVQALYERLLLEFHKIMRERNIAPKVWLDVETPTTADIEAKLLDLVDLIKPRVNGEVPNVSEQFVTITGLGFLFALSPDEYDQDFDPTFWAVKGKVGSTLVYDLGGLVVELLVHRWFIRRLNLAKAFGYYELVHSALSQFLSTQPDQEQKHTALGLLLIGILIKFETQLELLESFPWLGQIVEMAANELSSENIITEEQLLKSASEIINSLNAQVGAVGSLMSGALLALGAIGSGLARPIVARVEEAYGMMKSDGTLLMGSDIAYVGHKHPDLLPKSQPAVDALSLVEYVNGVKRKYTSSDFASADHTHLEYATMDDLKNAQYLYDGNRFYQPSDLALASHEHPDYLPSGQPVVAAKRFVNELFAEPLAPISHNHDAVYLRLDEVAEASYKLAGQYADTFALANHKHEEYITQDQASAMGELQTSSDNPDKGVKGLYTVFDQPGTAADVAVAVHYKLLTVSFSGSYTLNIPNVVFCHTTLIGPSVGASLPVVEYQTDVETGKRTGVVLRTATSEPVNVQVLVGYIPDVTALVERGIVEKEQTYKL
jgi:hypothetical protein